MSINLWSGVRSGGVQGVSSKKQTISPERVAGEFKELFEARRGATGKTEDKTGDSISISQEGSIAQKMEELKRIHEETDYSGMTDAEIYRTIEERYENVFPNLRAKTRLNYEKYQIVTDQKVEAQKDAIPGYPHANKFNGEEGKAFYNEARGYEGLSKAEIADKIKSDYLDNGSLEVKTEIMTRLWSAEAISEDAFSAFNNNLFYMERQEYQKTFGTVNVDMESDHYRNWKRSGSMEKVQMNWDEIAQSIKANIDVKKLYGEEADKELKNLFDMLSK